MSSHAVSGSDPAGGPRPWQRLLRALEKHRQMPEAFSVPGHPASYGPSAREMLRLDGSAAWRRERSRTSPVCPVLLVWRKHHVRV